LDDENDSFELVFQNGVRFTTHPNTNNNLKSNY
jgi:hypothetical protein